MRGEIAPSWLWATSMLVAHSERLRASMDSRIGLIEECVLNGYRNLCCVAVTKGFALCQTTRRTSGSYWRCVRSAPCFALETPSL